MSCEEIQRALSLYVDDRLAPPARATCDEHLGWCPVCRAHLAELRSITRRLSQLARPVPPSDLAPSISAALAIESAARRRQSGGALYVRIARWIEPRLMPYTVGTFASVILFLCMFSALRLSLTRLRDWDLAARQADAMSSQALYALEPTRVVKPDITEPVSPDAYAALRAPYAVESPSLNPRGALAALTESPAHTAHHHGGADDMVVVTDVFSNGSASLADVVRPPRDRRMLDEFQNALRKDPAFVPASFDRRPETMRVVLVVHKVNVSERRF